MKKVNSKLENIDNILELIPTEKQAIAKSIIQELIFMNETLENLKKTIREKGAEIEISNGSQHWTKERPAMNSYTKLIARYSTLFKQLCELMQGANTKNELIEFLKNFDFNSIDTTAIPDYSKKSSILQTVIKNNSVSSKQFYNISNLYEDVTGKKYTGAGIDGNSELNQDLKRKLEYAINNQSTIKKDSKDDFLFSIATTVVNSGKMSPKQKYRIDQLIKKYETDLMNV